MSRPRAIVMLGTDLRAPGGMTAVVQAYLGMGLFDDWPLRYLATFHRRGLFDRVRVTGAALRRFGAWCLRGEVAAVHAHTAARASFWRKSFFLLLGGAFGARTVLHLHDGSFPAWYERRSRPVQALVRWVLRRMDRVVLLTEGWRAWMLALEPAARCRVLRNPVPLPPLPARPRAGRVLFLGRLWREKGIDDLLAAAARIAPGIPELRLVCAGDGDVGRVGAAARSLGLADRIELPGWLDGDPKAAALREAAVFVLPSYAEGLPMGVLEAMAQGVPVVATDVGGVREALGEAGLLVPAGDVAGLAEALAALLQDPARAARLGRAGRERAQALFSPEQVRAELAAMYTELGLQPLRAPARPEPA